VIEKNTGHGAIKFSLPDIRPVLRVVFSGDMIAALIVVLLPVVVIWCAALLGGA